MVFQFHSGGASMRVRIQAGRRFGAVALCICLAATGCAGPIDVPEADGLADDTILVVAGALPLRTCYVWLWAWVYSETTSPDTILNACREAGAGRIGAVSADGKSARSVGGAGAFLIDTVAVDGTVAGNKLPRWTAVLSAGPEAPGSAASVAVSVTVADDDGNPANSVPAKIKVTAYDVDSNGKRRKAGRKTVKFDKQSAGADVVFDDLSAPRDHYEVDVVVKGGRVTGDNVNYSAATTTRSAAKVGSISARWATDSTARAGTTPVTTWAGVGIGSEGATPAGKVPMATIVVYPEQTSRLAGRSATFDIIGLAMQADDELDPPKQQLKKAEFTVYSVDGSGRRTSVGKQTGTVAKNNGIAIVSFEGVASPPSHFEIEARAVGGKMRDSSLSLSALVAPAGVVNRRAGVAASPLPSRVAQPPAGKETDRRR
jgi:hypothetical protein